MAHLVEKMAYVGQVPWHGLGNRLPENTNDIETWRREAGLDWKVIQTPVLFRQDEQIKTHTERSVLYRSDTGVPLSVMGSNYKVVQPNDVLEFYRDLCDKQGFKMHTAGSLSGGKRIWALAETGKEFSVMKKDKIGAYLLLATSMDGSLATRAMFTSIRVVCNNTLSLAYNDGADYISIRHSSHFDAEAVKSYLGIDTSWAKFNENVIQLAQYRLSKKETVDLARRAVGNSVASLADQSAMENKRIGEVLMLFNGSAMGSDLESANGTAWGFVNAVTQFVDHHVGRSVNSRMNSAWFGRGKEMKDRAMQSALELAA